MPYWYTLKNTHTHTCTCIYTHILKTILYSLRGDCEALSLLHFVCVALSDTHTHIQRERERIKSILRGFRVHQHSIEISDQIHFDMLDVSSTTVAVVTRWSSLAQFYSGCVTKGCYFYKVSVKMYMDIVFFFSYSLTMSSMFGVTHVCVHVCTCVCPYKVGCDLWRCSACWK